MVSLRSVVGLLPFTLSPSVIGTIGTPSSRKRVFSTLLLSVFVVPARFAILHRNQPVTLGDLSPLPSALVISFVTLFHSSVFQPVGRLDVTSG